MTSDMRFFPDFHTCGQRLFSIITLNAMRELMHLGTLGFVFKLWCMPQKQKDGPLAGDVHKFRKAAFLTAIQAQMPIVPVVFSSYKSGLNAQEKILNNGDAIVTALPVISTTNMTAKDVDELVQRTRKMMIETFNNASKETQIKIFNSTCHD